MRPESARRALTLWDAGEPIFTIEMGGLGPGYEQAIHIAVFETIRRHVESDLPDDVVALDEMFEETVLSVSQENDLHLSGAQAACAKQLAFEYLTRPWQEVLNEVSKDRLILVSKNFPGAGK